ncbi:hypothetical protein [Cupriavidus sp. IK-TO18]|uniref:hypothetical protein n=1 Tax=Cupriavidus sp. IK-TO18 TaxID=2782182 RepID=UPI001897EC35|nr:hypothetical protein [Cupriavidus sp. IK-TO18]MBF6987248.1 hypothetical protein [Cupriavidus sp. IK-TO18]
MTLNELITELGKAAPAAVVGVLQWITESLPTALLWLTFIYTALQFYVFVRDKLRRKVKATDETEA